MPGSYPDGRRSCRPFLITTYVADAHGELTAEIPSCCPSAATDQDGCALSINHRRRRKTGPKHPLAVAECGTHGRAFTLYPPGYAPNLRQPVVRLSPDGRDVTSESESKSSDRDRDLVDTVFEAALDGKHGRAWARDSQGATAADGKGWGSQGRRLRWAARMVGVAGDLADRVREAIGATLSVGTLVLRELSRSRGYRAIGKAVCDVLQKLRGRGMSRALQLLGCGHLVDRWGAPWRWDAARKVVERSPFLIGGTTPGG